MNILHLLHGFINSKKRKLLFLNTLILLQQNVGICYLNM